MRVRATRSWNSRGLGSAPAASLTVVTDHTDSTFQGPPLAGDETATLLGSLERQRATFAWKCGGLDAAGLRATARRLVDDPGWAAQAPGPRRGRLLLAAGCAGGPRLPPWDTVDWDADPDWEWRTAADDTPEQLYASGRMPWPAPAPSITEALADGGLDQLAQITDAPR